MTDIVPALVAFAGSLIWGYLAGWAWDESRLRAVCYGIVAALMFAVFCSYLVA